MGKPRKRHVQQKLFEADGSRAIQRFRKDGKRDRRKGNSGRKPKGKRAGSPHTTRPDLRGNTPISIVLRVVPAIGSLRRRFMYRAIREATISVALRELHDRREGAFRIVHVSIQRTHIHLIVEAETKLSLARGLQGFQISAAKHLNREFSRLLPERRRGTVFPDRYHQTIITSPKQARNALSYVLNNWRKHKEDSGRDWKVDPFSSGVSFTGWKYFADKTEMWKVRSTYQPLVVYLPKTWLLTRSWLRHGLVNFDEVPSANQRH
jgi:REP element-mobilizing transposase RayT